MASPEPNTNSGAGTTSAAEPTLGSHGGGLRKNVILFSIGAVALLAAFATRPLYESWKAQQAAKFRKKEALYRVDCLAAHNKNDWDKVESIAREWTAWHANTSDGWLLLGDALQQRADYAGAVDALLSVPEESRKAAAAYLEASHILFGPAGQPLKGVEICRRVVDIEPTSVDAWRRLIFFYAITLQRTEMLTEIDNAIRAHGTPPEAYVYLVLADHLMFTNGVELTSRWGAAQPDVDLFSVARSIHLNETLDHAESQDAEPQSARDARRKLIEGLLSQFPQNPPLLRYFLNRYVQHGQTEEAGRILAMLPEESASDSLFWRFRGWYLSQQGQLEQAAEAYRTSLELHAFDWRARFELSDVERQLGNADEARDLRAVGLMGKDLRKELTQLPNALEVPPELMQRIELYARRCGDRPIADAIRVQFFQ
jgi:tetratricopeptide (TPR) repeat protein